jgi:hypothetical protein
MDVCLRTFCRYGRFVPTAVLSPRMFCFRTFYPHGRFVAGGFVPPDVLSLYAMSPEKMYLDVLSGIRFFF